MSYSEENLPSVANVYPKDGGHLAGKKSTVNVLGKEEAVPAPLAGKARENCVVQLSSN